MIFVTVFKGVMRNLFKYFISYVVFSFTVEAYPAARFSCSDSSTIAIPQVCDGVADCLDASDESGTLCWRMLCPRSQFKCKYGACIPQEEECDGKADCLDGSDEGSCKSQRSKCSLFEFHCNSGECVHSRALCDGNKDCEDGSDEVVNFCRNKSCLSHTFRCQYGACVSAAAKCNGVVDCADGSDESNATCATESVYSDGTLPGTVAFFQCLPFYTAARAATATATSVCLDDGTWSHPPLKCYPECGKLGQEITPLIVNGVPAQYGVLPWQAALYVLQSGNWTFWCGGSLISENVVLTAAHCVWKQKTEYLRVALGKYYSSFHRIQPTTQIRDIKKVIMQPAYQDQGGNYGSDIALLFLNNSVEFSSAVKPVCVDWNAKYMDQQLMENNTGLILGWGVNENDTQSDSLRMTYLIVRGPEHCIAEQSRDFKKYVTYTSFCAGFRNGTGVCNGDSGGGLMFQVPHDNETWVVQGLVSVSPRRRGTSFCDPTKYTIFTKVAIYVKWIKSVLLSEGVDLDFD